MKTSYSVLSVATLVSLALAAPNGLKKRATPKVYLAGDSTMALGGGGAGTQGWGVYFPYSIIGATVLNEARGGRSARSFTVEGRFANLTSALVPGDTVIIEFGHNDGGSLYPTDNLRSDCPGSLNQTCTTTAGLVVQTYVTYLTNAAKAMVAKGAKVIISSQTPNNVCEGTTCSYSASRSTEYCKQVVKNVGSGATFIDHGQYTANRYIQLGKAIVDTYYPNDHTHTSPKGAEVVAAAFVKGLLCANGTLTQNVRNVTSSVPGDCI